MVVDAYLPALHSEEECVANLAFKVYFVADTEFLIRTFLPPAMPNYERLQGPSLTDSSAG
jgi:hypothetical protein